MDQREMHRERYERGELSLPKLAAEIGTSYEGLKKYAQRHGWVAPKRTRKERTVVKINSARLKRQKFAMGVAAGKTQKQAAIDAGYSPSRAKITGSELTARPDVQAVIQSEFNRAAAKVGLTSELIADTLRDVMRTGKTGQERIAAAKVAGEFTGLAQQAKEQPQEGKRVRLADLVAK